jgi:hypothetical protein
MLVLVDVIRVDFWMEEFIRKINVSLSVGANRWKCKIQIEAI